MEEQPATPADAAVQASAQVTECWPRRPRRWCASPTSYREGRKTLPGSAGWTWGRRWQQPY
eukprot:4260310-Prymnesium_polylepis.1